MKNSEDIAEVLHFYNDTEIEETPLGNGCDFKDQHKKQKQRPV